MASNDPTTLQWLLSLTEPGQILAMSMSCRLLHCVCVWVQSTPVATSPLHD
ncbi:hypothetical protein ASPVEDRAFT_41621, partial [Aspergillus versicolor CBS 583.65]